MRVLASLVLIGAWAIATPAQAYLRTSVDGMPDRPIFWADRAIAVELASGTSMDVAPGDLRAALDRSLATWTRAGGCTDVVLTDAGEALALTTNLDGGPLDHHNRVVVRETDWPAILGPETLAITTVLYERSSGAILDADTDLNGVSHTFSASEVPPAEADDVENTLTHEMGHLLGFAHASDPSATMFASAAPGETSKRDLADDDRRAICETYPIGAPTPTTLPPMPSSGCVVARTSRTRPLAWVALALLVSGLRALSRRDARRSHRAARAA